MDRVEWNKLHNAIGEVVAIMTLLNEALDAMEPKEEPTKTPLPAKVTMWVECNTHDQVQTVADGLKPWDGLVSDVFVSGSSDPVNVINEVISQGSLSDTLIMPGEKPQSPGQIVPNSLVISGKFYNAPWIILDIETLVENTQKNIFSWEGLNGACLQWSRMTWRQKFLFWGLCGPSDHPHFEQRMGIIRTLAANPQAWFCDVNDSYPIRSRLTSWTEGFNILHEATGNIVRKLNCHSPSSKTPEPWTASQVCSYLADKGESVRVLLYPSQGNSRNFGEQLAAEVAKRGITFGAWE